MTRAQMYDYNGYKITVRDKSPPVSAFDSRFPKSPARYEATSLDLAMKWVDAYRAGEHWAEEAAIWHSAADMLHRVEF